ncbi:MAG: S8 family serine peptidase [Planctomycetota bacterium]
MKRTCAGLMVVGLGLCLYALSPSAPAPRVPAAATPVYQGTWLVGVDPVEAAALARDHGLELRRTLASLDAVELHGPRAARAALAQDPRTRWVDENVNFHVAAGHVCAPAGATVGPADFARERELARSLRGDLAPIASGDAEVVVAVVDTGVNRDYAALRGSLLTGRSWLADEPWYQDYAGHGTSMATLIAAEGDDHDHADELAGVAPGVKVLPLKVANTQGQAKLADVAEAVVYAAERGAQVILLSLGTVRPAPLLDEALARAEESGALVIAAAGNRNTNSDAFPAAHPLTLSVGSCFPDGRIAPTTAFSPTTDVLFPGVAALVPRGLHEFSWVSGTSVSAARAAGVAALLVAQRPDTAPAAWRALLGDAHGPLELLADAPDALRILSAGPYDPALLAERLEAPRPELSLSVFRNGGHGAIEVTVSNPTADALPAGEVQLAGTYPVPALAPGARHVLRRAASWGARASHAQATWRAEGFPEVSLRQELPASTPRFDLALTQLQATPTPEGALVVEAEVENRGGSTAGQVTLRLEDGVVAELELPKLNLGERHPLRFEVPAAAVERLPAGEVSSCSLLVQNALDDATPENNAATLDLALTLDPAGAPPVRTLYQQSGELNIVLDAPWRLAPGRTYLPLLVFLPEKGDRSRKTWVRVDTFEVTVGGKTEEERRVVFRDSVGDDDDLEVPARVAPRGTRILDELGAPRLTEGQPDLRLFGHDRIYVPGRYNLLCLPKDALVRPGLDAPNTAGQVNYLEASAAWSNRRRFLFFFRRTGHGTSRRVMRVQFPNDARPQLGPGGHYLDTHVHTIAEWYQGSWLNLLAPRKNWGGPIPMLKESAYAIGLTPDVEGVRDRVITSDHNAFYNHSRPAHNTLKHRPPFGPTGSAMSEATERQVMQSIFGETCAEEVAFHAQQKMVGPFSLPLGAHMLTYRAQHITGAWHGGSTFARILGSPHKKTQLAEVIPRLTKHNRAENSTAATFAAHPANEGQGWSAEHLDLAFELDPAKRDDRSVHAEMTGFLAKGLQIWNGEFGRHSMPPGTIVWGNLDPWNDPEFRAGNPDWDQELNLGLRQWHELTSKTLSYELAAYPGIRFPRKVFLIAGSDAHGDFNGTEDRLATMVGAQATFDVDANAYGKALTYVLPREGESALDAMIAGHSVLTDGPLLEFALDADARWDPAQQSWDAAGTRFQDRDGQIGGGGPFDGQGTALVARGSQGPRIGFRYSSNREWGPLSRVALYQTTPGQPNAMGQRPRGGTLPLPVETFATTAPDAIHQASLPQAIQATTALSLGGYSRDPSELITDDRRCLTNAVYAVPFDLDARVERTEVDAQGNGSIPPGALKVRWAFDMSLRPLAYAVELKALSSEGRSTAVDHGPIDVLTPVGTWTGSETHLDCVYELTNSRPIPLNLDRFGSSPEAVTFVVSFRDAPQDPFGNRLNRIATTFEVPGIGHGGGVGPEVERGPACEPAFLGMVSKLGGPVPVAPRAEEPEGPAALASDASRPPVREAVDGGPGELAAAPLGVLERRLAERDASSRADAEAEAARERAEVEAARALLGEQPGAAAGDAPLAGPAPTLEPIDLDAAQPVPSAGLLGGSPSHLGSGFGLELGPTPDTDDGLDRSRIRAAGTPVAGAPLERVTAEAPTPVAPAGPAELPGTSAPVAVAPLDAGLAGAPVLGGPAPSGLDLTPTGEHRLGGAAGALDPHAVADEDTGSCSLAGPGQGSGWPALLLLALLAGVPALRRWA